MAPAGSSPSARCCSAPGPCATCAIACVATAPTPGRAQHTTLPTENQCDCTATPSSPEGRSKATIEYVPCRASEVPWRASEAPRPSRTPLRSGRRRVTVGREVSSATPLQLVPHRFGVADPARRGALGVARARGEVPPVAEAARDLPAGDAARAEAEPARLEGEQREASARRGEDADASHAPLALLIAEPVKAAAVDQELIAIPDPERRQTGDVAVHPAHLHARACGPLARPVERLRDAVDAGHAPAPLCQVD